MSLIVATDGACPGNPGPGGWAWVASDGRFDSGGEPAPSTNNRMELMAVLEALRSCPTEDLIVETDSMNIVQTFTEWLIGWKQRSMRKADGKAVLNSTLILQIDELTRGRAIEWQHVRGHAGHKLNERANGLAQAVAERYAFVPAKVTEFACVRCRLLKPLQQNAGGDVCRDCD